jgi:Ca2+-binding EF-hand superfamily protein
VFQEFKDVCKNLNKEQVEATFKKFDQTGNDKLNYREFRDMMNKKSEPKPKLAKQSSEAKLAAAEEGALEGTNH